MSPKIDQFRHYLDSNKVVDDSRLFIIHTTLHSNLDNDEIGLFLDSYL